MTDQCIMCGEALDPREDAKVCSARCHKAYTAGVAGAVCFGGFALLIVIALLLC